MDWRQFVMNLGPLDAGAVESLFEQHGARAVTLSDAGCDPVLEPARGETPLWRDTRISGLFTPDTDFDSLMADLCDSFSLATPPQHAIEIVPDRAWERVWLEDFRPMRFGRRLWVCPAGEQPAAVDAVVVRLDPGLAFGTGTHETTALCLEWLDAQDLRGLRVLDFGCGSGILGIAALMLGAASVHAIDLDPQAISATRDNAAQNGVAARLVAGQAPVDGSFDVVVANILAGPLIENATWLGARLVDGGLLALSGILRSQADEVRTAYSPTIDFAPVAEKDDWVRLDGRKH